MKRKELTLTVAQLSRACNKNKYLLLRTRSGQKVGLNTKIADIVKSKKDYPARQRTCYLSFTPCDLQTYITFKVPFI